jgi:hypothetical protein
MSTYMTQHCCRVNKESCHTPYFRVKLARRFLIFGADSFRLAIFFSVPIVMRLFFIPYKTINRTKTSNPKVKRHKLRKKKPYRETRARSKGSALVIIYSGILRFREFKKERQKKKEKQYLFYPYPSPSRDLFFFLQILTC